MNIQPHSEEPVKATTQSRSRLAEFSIPRRYSQQPLRIECRGKNRIGVTKIQPCSLEIPSVAGGNENQCVLSWGDTRRLRKASDPLLVRCPLKEGRPQQWRRPDQSNEVQLSDYGTGHTYVLEILNGKFVTCHIHGHKHVSYFITFKVNAVFLSSIVNLN